MIHRLVRRVQTTRRITEYEEGMARDRLVQAVDPREGWVDSEAVQAAVRAVRRWLAEDEVGRCSPSRALTPDRKRPLVDDSARRERGEESSGRVFAAVIGGHRIPMRRGPADLHCCAAK